MEFWNLCESAKAWNILNSNCIFRTDVKVFQDMVTRHPAVTAEPPAAAEDQPLEIERSGAEAQLTASGPFDTGFMGKNFLHNSFEIKV
jgi:hypothetical protein